MPRRKEPRIPDAILDQLLAGADPKTAFDPNGLLDGLKKALAERALNAEMDHHLAGDGGPGNSRNGYGRKSVLTDTGRIELEVPRDRQASFDPQLIAKYQRRFPGFDDKIVSMYARGMSTSFTNPHTSVLRALQVSRARAPCGAARAPCCFAHWAETAVALYGQGTAGTGCPRAFDIPSSSSRVVTRDVSSGDKAAPRGVAGSRAVHDLQARLDRILRVFATRRGSVDHVSAVSTVRRQPSRSTTTTLASFGRRRSTCACAAGKLPNVSGVMVPSGPTRRTARHVAPVLPSPGAGWRSSTS